MHSYRISYKILLNIPLIPMEAKAKVMPAKAPVGSPKIAGAEVKGFWHLEDMEVAARWLPWEACPFKLQNHQDAKIFRS